MVKNLSRPKHNVFSKSWKLESWQNVEARVIFISVIFNKLKTTYLFSNLKKSPNMFLLQTKCQNSSFFCENKIRPLKNCRIFCWSFWVLNGPKRRKSMFFVVSPRIDYGVIWSTHSKKTLFKSTKHRNFKSTNIGCFKFLKLWFVRWMFICEF